LDNNAIIGYIAGKIRKVNSCFQQKRALLDNMIVNEHYRSLGIGTLLADQFKKWCQDNQVEEILVDVFAKNNQGINFYKNNGFADYEVLLKYKFDNKK